jgi:hypothetical protein
MEKQSHLSLLFNIVHFCRKMLKGDAHIHGALLSTAVLHASHRWCPALSAERECSQELNTWDDVPRSLVQQKCPRFVLGKYLVRNSAWIRTEVFFRGLWQSIQANSFKSFPTHCSPIILPFDANRKYWQGDKMNCGRCFLNLFLY